MNHILHNGIIAFITDLMKFPLHWISAGDTLVGEASRVVVAEACIQALEIPCTIGQTYEVNSVEVSIYTLPCAAVNLVSMPYPQFSTIILRFLE